MSRKIVHSALSNLLLLGIAGCSVVAAGPVENLEPVSGTVTVAGQPMEGVNITFIPNGKNTDAHRGMGVTDSDGHFDATNYQNKEGLPSGTYTVLFSVWLLPDGTAPSFDQPPIISGAAEKIPPLWNDIRKSGPHNKVTIPEGGKTNFNFKIPKN